MNDLDNSIDLTDQNADMKSGVRLGLKMAAEFLGNYDAVSSHKYRLGDCLLAKFGIISTSEMRQNRSCDIAHVAKLVARELNISPTAIMGKGRMNVLVRARHLCAWLANRNLDMRPSEIARSLDQDPTSVLYAIRSGRKAYDDGAKPWRSMVDKIIAEVEG